MGKLGDLSQAMKLMKDKAALQGIVQWHEMLFRYIVYLKMDKSKYTPEQQEKMQAAFLENAEMYIEVLQKVGMLPEKPPVENAT